MRCGFRMWWNWLRSAASHIPVHTPSTSGLLGRHVVPLLCQPESDDQTNCRSPFFSESVDFPHSFKFYSHVANDNPARIQMANDFGSIEWVIPPWISCPCSIEAIRHESSPWGYFPFEFVMVGLDSFGLAIFKNNTSGVVGATLVQLSDGRWYNSSISTLRCSPVQGCLTPAATAETSTNLQWNSTSGKVSWSNGAFDQGIYLSSISNNQTSAPTVPSPRDETFLYVKLVLSLGYFAITDQQSRIIGFNAATGAWKQQIPNSSLTFSPPTSELVILDPETAYNLTLIAAGNMKVSLFLSEATNTGAVMLTRNETFNMLMGDTKALHLDVRQLTLTPVETILQTAFPTFLFVLGILAWVGIIAAILIIRRRRTRED